MVEIGFICVKPNSKWNFWRTAEFICLLNIMQGIWRQFCFISCRVVIFFIINRTFSVCFETIIIVHRPWCLCHALVNLGCLCHVLCIPQHWSTVAALGVLTLKYHLGCLNETLSFSIHQSFDTFPSFLFVLLKAIWTTIFVDAKITAQ